MKRYQKEREKISKRERKEKMHTVRPAGLKPGGASATPQSRNFLFSTVLSLFAQCKMHYW
jgi:hypothetical protein